MTTPCPIQDIGMLGMLRKFVGDRKQNWASDYLTTYLCVHVPVHKGNPFKQQYDINFPLSKFNVLTHTFSKHTEPFWKASRISRALANYKERKSGAQCYKVLYNFLLLLVERI